MLLLLWWSAAGIAVYSQWSSETTADAAVVLGAAAWGNRPSPIFRERINHAVQLYQSGRVERLIFTGGVGIKSSTPEALVARDYAMRRGVPMQAIIVETQSQSTAGNLRNAQIVAAANEVDSLLIVSTPFHMRRAMLIAERLQLNAEPSPTRTTVWRRNGSRVMLYGREMAALLYYQFAWQPLVGQQQVMSPFDAPDS